MRRFAFLPLFVCLAAGCSSNSPTESIAPFEPGTWSGTFSSEANYGPDGSVSQSGSVTFTFTLSDYTYEATVTSLTNRTRWKYWGPGTPLRDRGTLTKSGVSAALDDLSSLRATDVLQRSLYLHGRYVYSGYGNTMTFSRLGNGLAFRVSLTKQD